jgi:peroxiredoxin
MMITGTTVLACAALRISVKACLASIFLLLFCAQSFAQTVSVKVSNFKMAVAYLSSLCGEKSAQLDTIKSSGNGVFQFNTVKHHTGIYRLTIDKNKWIDFVNDREDVTIETDANNIVDSLTIVRSEGNQLYYSFIKFNKQYKTKTDLLQLILARYPKDDEYYSATQNKLKQIQQEYLEFVNIASQHNPLSFIARYIKSAQLPIIDAGLQPEQQLAYLKVHALDNVNFADDELINSDLFSNKSIEYLTYYRNPQLPKELLEKEFMVAVDTILNKAKVNPLVYKHVVEYLLDGFKKFGFDAIINYIIENYVIKDDICIDEKLETALQRRMDQAKYLKIGDTVPNIISQDITGKDVDLNQIKSDQVLIIFYASWCPHCNTLLPQINELYKNQKVKRTKVFAVSIDTSKTDWQKFINSNELACINVSDLKGWGGKAVLDYYLYATPTMFLVDRDRKIIGKPLSLEELKVLF